MTKEIMLVIFTVWFFGGLGIILFLLWRLEPNRRSKGKS